MDMAQAIAIMGKALGAGIAMGFGAIGPVSAKVMPLPTRWTAWLVSPKPPAPCVPT